MTNVMSCFFVRSKGFAVEVLSGKVSGRVYFPKLGREPVSGKRW